MLEISVSCKKMFDFVYKDPRLWLSIYIKWFPKDIKPGSELIQLKQRLKDGFKDTSCNWKDLYISAYKKYIKIQNEASIINLAKNFKYYLLQKLPRLVKTYKTIFISKNGYYSQKITTKDIKYLGYSIILTAGHEIPVQGICGLQMKILGEKIIFTSKIRNGINEGKIEIEKCLIAMVDKDIYTKYWIISYYDIARSLLKYKHPENDSSNFGFWGYSLLLDLHNFTESLAYHYERRFDFSVEGSKISRHIGSLRYKIPKDKMNMKCKSLVFPDKFDNICLVDFVLCSKFGNPLSGGSAGGLLKLEETNSNEGDGYSLEIIKESVNITILFRDKGKSFMLIGVHVEFDMSFIESIFKRDKPIRKK
ncbi:hypothetical protein SteCoe_9915 [Stentor coeruleus]|uniref:Uncharacterized protein n=1 Tax=Stentor coeruleus TaxID=5963 RepID=A0A1R2CGM9_9CILI|nr:hypothetical protein SteCoe_9915 [Stentor coeruleus]